MVWEYGDYLHSEIRVAVTHYGMAFAERPGRNAKCEVWRGLVIGRSVYTVNGVGYLLEFYVLVASKVISGWVNACLFLFYILATSKTISLLVLTCDSAHSC